MSEAIEKRHAYMALSQDLFDGFISYEQYLERIAALEVEQD